ncbi:MAG: substrate-binding domain-containing protein [Rhizonema sp. PD38]|nr:substrate-binding domain-containing protein [Rhizonema sp. PD38]
MKQDSQLRNNLKSIRTRLGMSQQDLAKLAGVTRQTISGVESGQYAPSVTITLHLAKALGCKVEDLFWFDQNLQEVEATLAKSVPCNQQIRVSLARVGGQWIAYPLVGQDAFRLEMIPADGEAIAPAQTLSPKNARLLSVEAQTLDQELPPIQSEGLRPAKRKLPKSDRMNAGEGNTLGYPELDQQLGKNKVVVKLLYDNIDALQNTVVIAGCAPVISLWGRTTERWHPQLRVQYNFANSMAALHSLCRGEAHIAGMHLYDPETGEHNTPFVRKVLNERAAVLITLGVWEEGLIVQPGNPMGIKTVSDVVEAKASIVNRELGAGSRMLLERTLQKKQIPFQTVKGFDRIVNSHHHVAEAVFTGIADVGISSASVAATFGLEFIPLHSSRYDLVILKEYLEEAPVQQLLSTLGHRLVHSQLEVLGGYDTSKTGDVVATV